MTKLLILLLGLGLPTALAAQDYHQATIVFADGHRAEGYARGPMDAHARHIRFKGTRDEASVRYPADLLRSVVYYLPHDTLIYDWLALADTKGRQRGKARWLQVVERGPVSLLRTERRSASTIKPGDPSRTHNETVWLGHRAGEARASILATHHRGSLSSNQAFRKQAAVYFSDYPDLAASIRSKLYHYHQVHEVVRLYNQWAQQQTVLLER